MHLKQGDAPLNYSLTKAWKISQSQLLLGGHLRKFWGLTSKLLEMDGQTVMSNNIINIEAKNISFGYS